MQCDARLKLKLKEPLLPGSENKFIISESSAMAAPMRFPPPQILPQNNGQMQVNLSQNIQNATGQISSFDSPHSYPQQSSSEVRFFDGGSNNAKPNNFQFDGNFQQQVPSQMAFQNQRHPTPPNLAQTDGQFGNFPNAQPSRIAPHPWQPPPSHRFAQQRPDLNRTFSPHHNFQGDGTGNTLNQMPTGFNNQRSGPKLDHHQQTISNVVPHQGARYPPPPNVMIKPNFTSGPPANSFQSHNQVAYNQQVQMTFPNTPENTHNFRQGPSFQQCPPPNVGNQPFIPNVPPFQQQQQQISHQTDTQSQSERPSQRHEATEEESDQLWINDWLESKGKSTNQSQPTQKKKTEISIHEAQDKIRRMVLLTSELQKHALILNSKVTDHKDEWHQEKEKVLAIKRELQSLQMEMSDEKNTRDLQRKVKDRRKKRERLKRRRREVYEEKEEELQKREAKHRQIDQFQEKLSQEQRNIKEEKELKESADKILNEVRKKISDASKTMELLNSLQKLRKLRKDRLQQQGVVTKPENDLKFDEVTSEQFKIMSKQNEIYLAEERALKVMLETEHEENKEKEREEIKKRQQQKELKRKRQEQEMLFGKPDQIDQDDPVFPHFQYYNQSEISFDSLLHIRSSWDIYLVPPTTPGSSRIPDGWIMPENPTSEQWATALKD